MPERITFVARMREASPPWLQRSVGGRVMTAIAATLDSLAERAADGVSMRFPGLVNDDSLSAIGRDRGIRRGPGEAGATYARRLRPWWDDHRVRGGPYALLRQVHAYLLAWLNVRVDVVYHSGTRRWIDEDGVITRDAITWSVPPDGDADRWAQIWVVYHLPDLIPVDGETLVTSDGEIIVTSGGDALVTTASISPGALTSAEAEIFLAIPREWSAAHIARTFVVLLYGAGELWDYPAPMGTWDEWESPTLTYDTDVPTVLVLE